MARRNPDPIIVPSEDEQNISWPSPPDFAARVRDLLFQNVLRLVPAEQRPERDGVDDEARVAQINTILRRSGRDYELRVPPAGSTFAVLVCGTDCESPVTEYAAFVPPHNGSRAFTAVDMDKLVALLGQPAFLESVAPKVRRFSVVSDLALYPYWLVGRRRLRRRGEVRPEVGVHYRFLQDFDPRREARLYRAITPRREMREDRSAGRRRWRGRLPA